MTSRITVFGQSELYAECLAHGPPTTHLISIRDPGRPLPSALRFYDPQNVLVLEFYDIEANLSQDDDNELSLNRHLCTQDTADKILEFYGRTKGHPGEATYAVHCWAGISRSTATALALLYLELGDEIQAATELVDNRPIAAPLRRLVKFFDNRLGTNLSHWAQRIHDIAIANMRDDLVNYETGEKLEELT